jgi:hypothetical protein
MASRRLDHPVAEQEIGLPRPRLAHVAKHQHGSGDGARFRIGAPLSLIAISASALQPVNCVATRFRNVTRPSKAVAITPSPMLASVVSNRSRMLRSAPSARAARSDAFRCMCDGTRIPG